MSATPNAPQLAAAADPAPTAEPAPSPPAPTTPLPLLLFDGECGLCDRSVQWILKRDRNKHLHFAPIQGEAAAPHLERHGLALKEGETYDTMVLIEPDGRARVRYAAALGILRHMGGVWGVLGQLGRVIPAFLANVGYRFVANRRLLFGAPDACRVPSPEVRARFHS